MHSIMESVFTWCVIIIGSVVTIGFTGLVGCALWLLFSEARHYIKKCL